MFLEDYSCLSVWRASRTKNDAAKLILVFLCILAFLATGFEDSVANMSLLLLPLFSNPNLVNPWRIWFNLFFVTLDNIIGECFLLLYLILLFPLRVKKKKSIKKRPLEVFF